jgi:outer membrane murein-binding lipoprotein Lpp
MKRFLMLVAVAVVASAMYVAASPASQQSSGSTTRQVRALQARVAKMSKVLRTVRRQAQYARDYVHDCLRTASSGAMPVSEFGDAVNHTHGYQYFDGATTRWTTALDIDTGDTPGAFLQKVDRACANR